MRLVPILILAALAASPAAALFAQADGAFTMTAAWAGPGETFHGLPPATPSPMHGAPLLPEDLDLPATPIDGVYRVAVLLDELSWAAHDDQAAWAKARLAVAGGYFRVDHNVRFDVCLVERVELGNANEMNQIRSISQQAVDAYWDRVSVHTGLPMADAFGGPCGGLDEQVAGREAVDLLVVFVGKRLYCNGVEVGGCAAISGDFSMNRDYAASWGDAAGNHPVEHILQHELSHNFGARDNECEDYGIMDYDHTYQSHDWCTKDEARMTVGKNQPRAWPWGAIR